MSLFKGKKYIFVLSLFVGVVFSIFSLPVFAEGDNLCASRFVGTTDSYSDNAGLNYFDAHGTAEAGDSATGGGSADLSIVYGFDGGGSPETGPAPVGTHYAACLEDENVDLLRSYSNSPEQFGYSAGHNLTADYEARGWFWNDNWGFVSMACQDGVNQAGPDLQGSDYDCDPGNTGIEYGAYLGPEYDDGSGKRDLFGYVWGENLGWIQLKGEGGGFSSWEMSEEYNINEGETISIDFYGSSYDVTNHGTNPFGEALISVNGSSQRWIGADAGGGPLYGEGNPLMFGDVYVHHVSASYDEAMGIDFSFTFTLEKAVMIPEFDYGVVMEADGSLSGYAWTEAGIYISFDGASIDLIDDDVEVAQVGGSGYCSENNIYPICVEVDPYPGDLDYEDYPVADCTDGYDVTVYARDEDGNALELDTADYDIESLDIVWVDTVRADQIEQPDEDYDFNEDEDPWAGPAVKGVLGAVNYKVLDWDDFSPLTEGGVKTPGVFVSDAKVSSCAPTSNSNISYTTSTNPSHSFSNETFITPSDVDADVSNRLELVNVKYGEISEIIPGDGGPGEEVDGVHTLFSAGTTQANGIGSLSLRFKPAVEVSTLYEGDAQDAFIGQFGFPNNFAFEVSVDGDASYLSEAEQGSVTLNLHEPECETDPDSSVDYHFANDFDGSDIDTDTISGMIISLVANGQMFLVAEPETVDACSDLQITDTAVYSEVSYDVGGNEVAYYHNKLPRIDDYGAAFSFYSYIVGKVNAEAFGLMGDVNQNVAIDTSNVVNVTHLDAAIDKNISDLGFSVFEAGGDTCDIRLLSEIGGSAPVIHNCVSGVDYEYKVVGDEQLLYFVNADVRMMLTGGGSFDGKWNIVVQAGTEKGNIFIDQDIYNDDTEGKHMNLIAKRPWTGDMDKGNIYIKPCIDGGGVKNIQAALIADGSVFSYSDINSIDEDTGEPIWGSVDAIDYSEMLGALSTCQLFLEGVVSSNNSIGGAKYVDEERLLLGGGRFIDNDGPASLMKAQLYDIHYLRAFTASLDFDADGNPIDQNCGTGLSNSQIADIAAGATICGDRGDGACDPDGSQDQEFACNGINSEAFYVEPSAGEQAEGDLIPPLDDEGNLDTSVLSKGIYDNDEIPEEEKYFPAYIFYRPLPKDSFLFKSDTARNLFGY